MLFLPSSSPFQISRRGWGEFPIRVQLYFHANIQQKPLQIFHNLVLDKKLTGLQTMGAETVVEMWLKLPPKPTPLVVLPPPASPRAANRTPTRKVMVTPKKSPLVRETTTSSSPVKIETNAFISSPRMDVIPDKLFEEFVSSEPAVWDHESVINHEVITPNPTLPNSLTNGVPVKQEAIQFTQPPPIATAPIAKAPTIKIEPSAPIKMVIKSPPVTIMTPPLTPHPATGSPSHLATPPPASNPAQPPRKFMKCLDSNGKVVLVELQIDPNNPKSFRILKNPKQIVKTMVKTNQVATTPLTNPIKIGSTTAITSTTPNGIKAIAPGSMVLIPKSSLNRNNNTIYPNTGSTSGTAAVSTIPPTAPRLILTRPQAQPTAQPLARPSNPVPVVRPPPSIVATQPPLTSIPTGLIKSSNVIMRNGKVFIIDPTKVVAKSVLAPNQTTIRHPVAAPPSVIAAKPKQQSLLKPQISLLKPRPAVPPTRPQTPMRLPKLGVSQRVALPTIAHPGLLMRHKSLELYKPKPKVIVNGGSIVLPPPTGRLMRLPSVVLPPEKSVFSNRFTMATQQVRHNAKHFFIQIVMFFKALLLLVKVF